MNRKKEHVHGPECEKRFQGYAEALAQIFNGKGYDSLDGLLIESNKDVMGGAPVIKGTRIPVEQVKIMIQVYMYKQADLQKEFPQVGSSTIDYFYNKFSKSKRR